MAEQRRGGRDAAYLLGAGFGLYVFWVVSTILGRAAGDLSYLVENWGLDYLTTAFFVALLAGFWRGRGDALPWLVAGGVAVAAKWWLPGTWYIVLGAVAGSLVGAWRDSAMTATSLLAIVLMGAVTYASRAGGFWLARRLAPGPFLRAWLEHLPGAVFAALVAPMVIGAGPAGWIAAGVGLRRDAADRAFPGGDHGRARRLPAGPATRPRVASPSRVQASDCRSREQRAKSGDAEVRR